MKRLLRILFNAATVLSMVLCVVFATLSARSYWVGQSGELRRGHVGEGVVVRRQVFWYWVRGIVELEVADTAVADSEQNRKGLRMWIDKQPPARPPYPAGDGIRILEMMMRKYAAGRAKFARGQVGSWLTYGGMGRPPYEAVWVLDLHLWWIAAALGLLPGMRLFVVSGRAIRRRRRRMAGRCVSCGYDLRATPGRCPECGTASAAH
jgi:hypothetical protein